MTKTMTKNEKLNELVRQYRETGITYYFDQAYAIAKKQIGETAGKFAKNNPKVPVEDFISEGNYRFISAVEISGNMEVSFQTILGRVLRNAFLDITKAAYLKADFTDRYFANDGKEIDLLEDVIIAGITKDAAAEAEGLVFADQRSEMIASLLVGASDEMIATVRVFLAEKDLRKAGRVLGVSHTTVKRRLESLAKKFDASKYGQVSDYIEGVETIVS